MSKNTTTTAHSGTGLPLAWPDWIADVEREMGTGEPLPARGREDFRKYFNQGMTPAEALYEDREAASV